jgi:dTDP-4-dehydrorhamnose reductase
MARVLIFGGTGMLATALVPVLAGRGHDVVPLGPEESELLDPSSASRMVGRYRPQVIINAAALTDVDGCEFSPDLAMAINGRAAGRIAEEAAKTGCPLIHISTDYVFDGTSSRGYEEEDRTGPRSRYGRTKLVGELSVAAAGGEWTIVRTAWLFGPGGKSFPKTVYAVARAGGELRVVNDQTGSPTYTFDLADAVANCLERGSRGIYHMTNCGRATWYEVALEVVGQAGIACLVTPVSTGEFERPAPRPAFSVLSNDKAARELGIRLPEWRSGVSRFVHDHLLKGGI